ncbi:MAG: hypothetical protein MR936_04820 [Eubacterium sp.]|nr:hypothetical protein [Eubacterium sp.]
MKRYEDNHELCVTKMDVVYPADTEIENQIEQILSKGLPEKISFVKRLKEIYFGPGLFVIFYSSIPIWAITIMVYIVCCIIFAISFENKTLQIAGTFLGMPLCFLVFSLLSCYLEEQAEICELKNTMHYSMNFIVSLRMFYTAIFLSTINGIILLFCGIGDKVILSIGIVGVTSMLLFAIAAVYIYHTFNSYLYFCGLIGLWILFVVEMIRLPENEIIFFLEYIPLGVQIAVAVTCFVILLVLIRKKEEKDAYTFACY